MMMRNALVLGLAVVSAAASPLIQAQPGVSTREDASEPWESKEGTCEGWDQRSLEGVADLWEKTAAGIQLELRLKIHWEGEHNWLKNLEDYIGLRSGATDVDGCSNLDTTCNPGGGMNCGEWYDKMQEDEIMKNHPLAISGYWIFQAAKGVHDKLGALKTQLTEEAIINDLKIDQMVKEFGGNSDGSSDVTSWLAAAAGMGGAISSAVPGGTGVAAGAGILAAIFGAVGEDEDSIEGEVRNALGDAYKKARDALQKMTSAAMGVVDSDEELEALPAPVGDFFETDIAKFFDGGWFLLESDTDIVRNLWKSTTDNLRTKVVDHILSRAGYHLMADKRKDSFDECGLTTGRQWMKLDDGEEYCFYLARHSGDGVSESYDEAKVDIYDKMAEYGLGHRENYYNAILDCAINGDGKIDSKEVAFGKVPTCYFSLKPLFIESRSCGPNPRVTCKPWKVSDIK